jgi:hypothetical protein
MNLISIIKKLILITHLISASILFNPLPAHAASQSRAVTINNTLSAQTNYPVEIQLNTANEITAGNMRSDCGDIRAVANDLVTNLTYAFLNCNTMLTSIIVIIPTLPLGNTNIFITFGDNLLTTTQAPASVFDIHQMFTSAPTCTLAGTNLSLIHI